MKSLKGKTFTTILTLFMILLFLILPACSKYTEDSDTINNILTGNSLDVKVLTTASKISSTMRKAEISLDGCSKIILGWNEHTDEQFAVILYFISSDYSKEAMNTLEDAVNNLVYDEESLSDKNSYSLERQDSIVYIGYKFDLNKLKN